MVRKMGIHNKIVLIHDVPNRLDDLLFLLFLHKTTLPKTSLKSEKLAFKLYSVHINIKQLQNFEYHKESIFNYKHTRKHVIIEVRGKYIRLRIEMDSSNFYYLFSFWKL